MAIEKTFDAAEAEPRIAEMWETDGCFQAGANASKGADSYCIVIPPPNVTGSLHMGHALNNTLQDILIRWKRMQGFDVLWQPGQDHAGIATQMVVERKLAAEGSESRRDMGRAKFLEKVWAWKEESGDTIIGQLKRLGASCDWSRNRFTMDEGLSAAVRKVFVQLFKEGLIYKDKRLVNWDPHFETAISDLEVELVEVAPSKSGGKLWRFRYPLADGVTYEYREALSRDEDGNVTEWSEPETRDYLVVATTRPETMLGDSGVAVHPDDERYKDLVGKEVLLPLVNRRIPIVADDYADQTKGTGAVKMTPAHDFNDFQVGKRQNLRLVNVMTTRAAIWLKDNPDFLEGAEPEADAMALDGLDRFDARQKVIELLDARGLYDGADDNPHEVPHGDRSKVVIEPYLTDQWFVDAHTLAQPALEAVRSGETVFAPQNWEKTYFQWLDNIEPWCVSRQLWWGHQIPVWYGPDGHAFCEETEKEAQTAAKKHYNKKTKVPLTRDEDVLDTWFSSALWPFSTLGWPAQTPELQRYYKTDVLVTGFDIIFFWVARMMMMGKHFMKDAKGAPEAPFHTVYVHALVRDEQGKKMSKSLGNVIDPLELIDQFGADAVRFTLTSMAAMGRDIKLAVSRVEGYRNFGTKLWNAARFCEMNGCARDAKFDPSRVEQSVNRWIVGETARAREACDAALASYRFNDYAAALYNHVWRVFCDWYLELSKPLLQSEEDPTAKAETQATAAWALDQILLLMHPVSPFLTEELWRVTTGEATRKKPLVHGDWPTYSANEFADEDTDEEMQWVIRLIEEIRSVRSEMNAPPSAKVPLVLVGASPAVEARMQRNEAQVMRLARLESWEMKDAAPKGAVAVAVEEATACLVLADVIDVAAERKRLEKALAKAQKEAGGIEKKLSNESFLAKAPLEVVEEQRERLEAAKGDIARLGAALERLAEMG
ncbi:MAG: valine--tRNA ligase [Neomegalonema sp.]|nr:valine--tRNA ligase [Neomegalonema sp.]